MTQRGTRRNMRGDERRFRQDRRHGRSGEDFPVPSRYRSFGPFGETYPPYERDYTYESGYSPRAYHDFEEEYGHSEWKRPSSSSEWERPYRGNNRNERRGDEYNQPYGYSPYQEGYSARGLDYRREHDRDHRYGSPNEGREGQGYGRRESQDISGWREHEYGKQGQGSSYRQNTGNWPSFGWGDYSERTHYRRENLEDSQEDWRRSDVGNGQYSGRGPKNWRRSDEKITEDVNEHLTDDSWIDASDLQVSVKNGEVTLTGNVSSRYAKRHAEDIAGDVSGVTQVHNQLRVEQESRDIKGKPQGSHGGKKSHGHQ